MVYSLARSLLFQLDAETAHDLAIHSFRNFPRLATAAFSAPPIRDPYTCFGLTFANRIGLAAGLDKNGECLRAWSRLGFGFVEVGTVTPRPQPGNPRPRLFRLAEHESLINRLGFNNRGVDYLLSQVDRADYRGILGINIGKNADTPIERAGDDYRHGLEKVYTRASYVTVNISSPNTQNLRDLQAEAPLRALLADLRQTRDALSQRHGKRTPILVKIAPDISVEALPGLARIVQDSEMDGLIASNTTLRRPHLQATAWADETGGLSGKLLTPFAEKTLQTVRASMGRDFPLIGVGGIMSADDARVRCEMGADLIQIYTAFIYKGPAVVAQMARAVAALQRNQ